MVARAANVPASHPPQFYLEVFTAHQTRLDEALLRVEAKYPEGDWTRMGIERAAENNMRKILFFEALIQQQTLQPPQLSMSR